MYYYADAVMETVYTELLSEVHLSISSVGFTGKFKDISIVFYLHYFIYVSPNDRTRNFSLNSIVLG